MTSLPDGLSNGKAQKRQYDVFIIVQWYRYVIRCSVNCYSHKLYDFGYPAFSDGLWQRLSFSVTAETETIIGVSSVGIDPHLAGPKLRFKASRREGT